MIQELLGRVIKMQFLCLHIHICFNNLLVKLPGQLMLQQLAGQTTWTIGASFKLAPSPFKHCFVVGVLVRSQLIVAAHALLTENSEQLCMEALNAVVAAIRPAKPRRVITDFENSVVVAAQNVFTEAHVSGCYFRFSQELFRKWSEFNLGDIYGNEDSQAGNIARMTFRFFSANIVMLG
ncbi:unnamed protein product [Meloidogyne enterolobii]|uniref:Uncharacterized protein n=1 Tax=Meloidogyne enterolobii TaxID=390850 RepID=A0ACB0XZY0_MELEN